MCLYVLAKYLLSILYKIEVLRAVISIFSPVSIGSPNSWSVFHAGKCSFMSFRETANTFSFAVGLRKQNDS